MSANLLDSEFIKRLEYLSLVSRRVFRGTLMAQRRTKQHGGGIEFADHRDYTPGDDFRYLDWHLYARHDELLLKRFQEEEDLHVYLFLDCSRSMTLGDPPKIDYAKQVVAALAYIALADLDRAAVIGFAGNVTSDFPLTRGKARVLALLRFLEALPSEGVVTDLARAASTFVHRGQRRGLAIVVSDFYDPQGFRRGLDVLRRRGFDLHVVQVHDPAEANPALKGDLELYDVESGGLRKVTIAERTLRRYRQVFETFQQELQRYCHDHGLGCTRTSTEVPFDQLILRMMRAAGELR